MMEENQIPNSGEQGRLDRVEGYLRPRYDFHRNIVTGCVEYKKKGENSYRILSNDDENSLWRELNKARITVHISTIVALLNSDFSPAYDPFLNFFNKLPDWDGETDHIKALADGVETHNPELWKLCLRRWLIALVGSLIDPKVVNHQVLVFSGPQGIGKTTWINNLVPDELKEYYFSGTINPDNKDTYSFMSDCMLINMDELENLNRSQVGSLKECITKGQLKVRRPFRRNPEVLMRRASFAGSVNSSKFLNDPTGSRRFLCFEVSKFEKECGASIEQVYSQVLALFKSGEQHYFDGEDNNLIQANNSKFEQILMEEEWVKQLFLPCDPTKEVCEYMNASDVAVVIRDTYKQNVGISNINNIGRAMTKLAFSTAKKDGYKKYVLKRQNKSEQLPDADASKSDS
jgi:predicted P-loop ATPase